MNKVCTKCNEEKPIESYVVCRRGRPDEYRLNYCNSCRHKQINTCRMKSWDKFVRNLFNRKRVRQKETNRLFTIDNEYGLSLLIKQDYKCAFSGEPLEMTGVGREVPSLDRVDNSKDYEKGNVVWVKYKYNVVKNDLTLDEFKTHLPKWFKRCQKILKDF